MELKKFASLTAGQERKRKKVITKNLRLSSSMMKLWIFRVLREWLFFLWPDVEQSLFINEEIIFNSENICWFNFTLLLLVVQDGMKHSRVTCPMKIMETFLWIILFGIFLMLSNYSASEYILLVVKELFSLNEAQNEWRVLEAEINWCEFEFIKQNCWVCGFLTNFISSEMFVRTAKTNSTKDQTLLLFVVWMCHWSML